MSNKAQKGNFRSLGSFQNLWIGGAQPRPEASVRLFCFPYAGGGASAYRAWSKVLIPEIELCPVQLPGREMRLSESPSESCFPLVDEILEGVQGMLDKPFILFGHSMGAILAFEFCRALGRRGLPRPVMLCVSAAFAPHRYISPELKKHRLPKPELLKEIQRLGGTPPEVLAHSELIDMLLPTLRADLAMVENYQYREESPLDFPILAFGGREDPEVGGRDLKAWGELSRHSFSHYEFPGDHFYLNSAYKSILGHIQEKLLGSIPVPL